MCLNALGTGMFVRSRGLNVADLEPGLTEAEVGGWEPLHLSRLLGSPSIHLFIYLSIYLNIYQSIYLPTYLSAFTYLSIYQLTYLSIYQPI